MDRYPNIGDIATKPLRTLLGNRCMAKAGLTLSDSVEQTATVTLSGTFDVGDIFTVTINSTTYTYTVLLTDTNLDGVATALASLVDANAAVAATATGAVITVVAEVATVPFTISAGATNDAAGTADNQAIALAITSSQVATVTVGGTFDVGDVFTVTIDGTPYAYTVLATDTNTDGIATALAALVDASGVVSATAIGSVITVTKETAGLFTITSGATNDAAGTNDQGIAVAVTSQTATATVGGVFEAGDIFNLTLGGTLFSHVVVGGDVDNTGIATAITALVTADPLYATSTSTNEVITIRRAGEFTIVGTTTETNLDPADTQTFVVAITAQTATATLSGTVDIGDLFSITIDGTECAYTVLAADTTLDAIAVKLELLTEQVAGITSSATGAVITLDKAGAMVITSSTTNDAAGTNDQTCVSAITSTQTTTATLSGAVNIGDVYNIVVAGNTATYTVLAAATTLDLIAAALELQVEGLADTNSSATGAVITITKATAGSQVITATATNDAVGTDNQTATVANTVNSVKEAETDNAITYSIDGKVYAVAAVTGIVIAGYSTPIMPSSFRWYAVQVDSAGAMTTVAGADNENMIPDPAAGKTLIGAIKIATNASTTFTPTVTALNATGVTTTYFNLSCVPKAGYPEA